MDHIVIKKLSVLSEEYPLETVYYLKLMIEGDKERWRYHSWKDDSRKMLSTALESTDEKARNSAFDLINRLGALGNLEFRDLLGQ